MSYKTIAAYISEPEIAGNVITAALPLAEEFDAHLIGIHVAYGIPVAGTIGAQIPPDIVQHYLDRMREDAKTIEKKFTKAVGKTNVKSEWRSKEDILEGTDVLNAILNNTRCTDLVVMGQGQSERSAFGLTADIILGSGRPVIVLPAEGKSAIDPARITIGWDGSREAARATFDALPLLKKAKAVHLVTIGKGDKVKDALRTGDVDIAETLARHDIPAEIVMIEKSDKSAGETLMSYVADQKCGLLVMGCYSHSRLRERLFGGATRQIFDQMSAPVLMSH